ncbi:MAG: hypothetical protein KDK70_24980, partial [Myxococcales bacterium]|nr:hypothetical protein [Myxococcales bacterium]
SPHPIRLFDIDGDGRPEMVDPRGCFQLCEATQWLVYDAEANGFTAAPRPYAVPSHVACNGLTRPSEQRARWMDFTLDGVPDVLTADLEGDRWILDRGTDTGVEPGIELPTPTIADLPLVGVHSYSGDPVQFDIVALDESRPPALVVTARPDDPDVGQLHWEVYPFECAGP